MIGVHEGRIALSVGDEKVVIKLLEEVRHIMNHDDTSYFVDDADIIISNWTQELLLKDRLEEYLGDLSNKGEEIHQDSSSVQVMEQPRE